MSNCSSGSSEFMKDESMLMSSTIIEVISILAGFIAIWINEHFAHKRDVKHKWKNYRFLI